MNWTLEQLQFSNPDPSRPCKDRRAVFFDPARVSGDDPVDQRHGLGPLWKDEEGRKFAEQNERYLVRAYINSFIRGKLFLALRKKTPRIPILAEGGTFLLGHHLHEALGYPNTYFDGRPIRTTADGKLIDPLIIGDSGQALINPEWTDAEVEYGFWLAPGAEISICGGVERDLCPREGYMSVKYKILLGVGLPSLNDLEILRWTR